MNKNYQQYYSITNGQGITAQISPQGATVLSLTIETAIGIRQLLLSSDDPNIIAKHALNSICGRVANRIDHGQFILNGQLYQLDCNDGVNHLHGGENGLQHQLWQVIKHHSNSITLSYLTQDDGYPGVAYFEVEYLLQERGFQVTIQTTAIGETVVNPTWHNYFNVDGINFNSTIEGQYLQINADHYLPVDQNSISNGQIKSLSGSIFGDFQDGGIIDLEIFRVDEMRAQNGLDHSFVLNQQDDIKTKPDLLLESRDGLVSLVVVTNQPTLHIYAGNFVDQVSDTRRQGAKRFYHKHAALSIEAQQPVNAINVASWRDKVIIKDQQTVVNKTYFILSN